MNTPSPLGEADPLLDRFVNFLAHGGWAGVDLFFVLSGFLITGILIDSKGTRGYFKTFYARRFLRIFPAYYGLLAAVLILVPNTPYVKDTFGSFGGDGTWYWLYLSNFHLALDHPWAPNRLDYLWSLAVEEHFYLIWPMIVLVLRRQTLMKTCLGLIGAALLSRAVLVALGVSPAAVFAITPCRVDGLAVGAFIALVARTEGGVMRLARFARPLGIASLLGVAAIAVAHGNFDPYTGGMQILGHTLLALFFGSLLVLVLVSHEQALASRVFRHSVLRTFGRYSYALYLIHIHVFMSVGLVIFRAQEFPTVLGSRLPGQFLFLVVAVSVSLAGAWFSWHLYEKRFLDLKRYFPHQRQSDQGSIPVSPGGSLQAATAGSSLSQEPRAVEQLSR